MSIDDQAFKKASDFVEGVSFPESSFYTAQQIKAQAARTLARINSCYWDQVVNLWQQDYQIFSFEGSYFMDPIGFTDCTLENASIFRYLSEKTDERVVIF